MKAVGNGFRPARHAHARTVGTQGRSKQVGRPQSVVTQPLQRVISISVLRSPTAAMMGRSANRVPLFGMEGRAVPGGCGLAGNWTRGETKDH